MDNDQAKALFVHRLELRKLVVDKILLGLVVLVLGFMANLLLERYKSQSIQERFLLEKRLEAVQNVSQAYMGMHNAFDRITLQPALAADDPARLEQATQAYIDAWTEWGIILSRTFRLQQDYITWIYLGLQFSDLETMKRHRSFLFDLYYAFNALAREELDLQEEQQGKPFPFVEWSAQQADSLGAQEYLRASLESWKLSTR